jgi:hypothetical protein
MEMQFDPLHTRPDKRTGTTTERKGAFLTDNREQKPVAQLKENNTGLPDNLKSGIESLSGISMDDVKVNYNSAQPAQLNAHAYAQGSQIHLAPGQEKHLPHEAWHVVQQKQGRVRPTAQLKGKVNVNDDTSLEKEADVMGAKAVQFSRYAPSYTNTRTAHGSTTQLKVEMEKSKLSKTQDEQFEEAYNKFNSAVLSKSPINTMADIIVSAISNEHIDTLQMPNRAKTSFKSTDATTLLWLDHQVVNTDQKFEEIWELDSNKQYPAQMPMQLVITVNMSMNESMETLYSTLLHEWYAHGRHWEQLIQSVYEGKGAEEVKKVKDTGSKKREKQEHIAYAGYSKEYVEELVKGLQLGDHGLEAKTIHEMDQDVLHYSPVSGARLGKPRVRTSGLGKEDKKNKSQPELKPNNNKKKRKIQNEDQN